MDTQSKNHACPYKNVWARSKSMLAFNRTHQRVEQLMDKVSCTLVLPYSLSAAREELAHQERDEYVCMYIYIHMIGTCLQMNFNFIH